MQKPDIYESVGPQWPSKHLNLESPSARKHHAKRFSSPAHGKHQVGRGAQTWLPLDGGIVSMVIGWAFAFAAIFFCPAESISDELWTPYGLTLVAVMFIAFGCGYMCHEDMYRIEERGEK